jgi:ABC-type multidrug transport system ATPase subunit
MIRISHDAHVFEKTVRRNLMMGKKTATDDELIDALKTVRLYDEIEHRGGLELEIKSGGSNLSGGQKQRLVLARALLRNAKVYVFDEATSNIDIESESVILQVMKNMAQDHIVILVSHRLYAGKDAEKIYVLDDGKIVEEGTFEELLERDGVYRQLWQAQARFETEDRQNLYARHRNLRSAHEKEKLAQDHARLNDSGKGSHARSRDGDSCRRHILFLKYGYRRACRTLDCQRGRIHRRTLFKNHYVDGSTRLYKRCDQIFGTIHEPPRRLSRVEYVARQSLFRRQKTGAGKN